MRIAAFPKCYLEEISTGRMSLFAWIEQARALRVDGLELYERFLLEDSSAYLDGVGEALTEAGFEMPMLCCSPDFTSPDATERRRAVEREARMIGVARHLGGPGAACRVLSGQRHPGVGEDQGVAWVVQALEELLPVARELDVVLALENHYKDDYWTYPEFAQDPRVFSRILDAIGDRAHFGVQYDPSNALVAGVDPVEFLRGIADRVVTMQASDRYLAPGVTLEDLSAAAGTQGHSQLLSHGIVGEGLNDYDAILRVLRGVGYDGWISIEDGLDGMAQMAASVAFLRLKIDEHPPLEPPAALAVRPAGAQVGS